MTIWMLLASSFDGGWKIDSLNSSPKGLQMISTIKSAFATGRDIIVRVVITDSERDSEGYCERFTRYSAEDSSDTHGLDGDPLIEQTKRVTSKLDKQMGNGEILKVLIPPEC